MPEISFVALTYNSAPHIEKLIKRLLKHFKIDIQKGNIEIVVADNNSQDRTTDILKKFKDILIIKNKKNLGFSKGINRAAFNISSDFIVIINPDSEFIGGNLWQVIEMFEKDKKLGAIGGKITKKNGEAEKSAGRFLKTLEVFLMSLGLDEFLGIRSSPKNFKEVDFVSGGFMIVRKDLFQKLSGFDENLFMYTEDMEFCFRLKKQGYRVLFDPQIVIIHESHGSSSRKFAIKNIYEGLLYFQKKHGNPSSYFLVKSMIKVKAYLLVIIGRIINNSYLINTYSQVLKI